jgi:hypothetical protein
VHPVRYELEFYIPEDDILHSHRRENLKSYRHKIVRQAHEPFAVQTKLDAVRAVPDISMLSVGIVRSRTKGHGAHEQTLRYLPTKNVLFIKY